MAEVTETPKPKKRVILLYGNDPDYLHAKMYPWPLSEEHALEIIDFAFRQADRTWRYRHLYLAERRDLLHPDLYADLQPEMTEDDWRKFTEKFTHDTNAIEGSTLTRKQVRKILQKTGGAEIQKRERGETVGQ